MKSITVITCFLLAIIGLKAQELGEQVMIKGTVIDVNTKQPIAIDISFEPPTGSKFVVKSAEGTGKFEQLFQSGTTYNVIFTGDNVYRTETTYTPMGTPNEGYSEAAANFEVKGLNPGVVVEELNIFGANSTDLTAAGKEALNNMKVSMRFNRNASFIFQVNGTNKNLADSRIKTLKDYIADWRKLTERIDFQSGTTGNNLVIKVKSIKDSTR